jgi:cobalamin biosynthesis Co2+ chelatase CbiK
MFNSHLMPFLNSAYYINDYLHHYNRDNPNSLTKTYDDTLLHKFSNLFKELRLTIEKNYSNSKEYNTFLEALDNRIALSTINIGLGYVSKGLSLKGFKKFKSLLLSDTYQKALKKLKTNYLPLHFRTFFILCKHGVYSPAYFLLNIMQKLRQND